MKTSYALTRTEYERELDTALAGSFPASDPPPWTFGASPWMEVAAPILGRPVPAAVDVIVRDGYRVGGIRLAGLGSAWRRWCRSRS
jgi:hypothetical protein